MTVRELAEQLGRPASTYAAYEDKYKKPYLPIELIKGLEKILVPRGIPSSELYALAGVQSGGMMVTPKPSQASKGAARGIGAEMIKLDELDIRAVAGLSGIDPADMHGRAPVVAEWSVPRPWISQVASGPAPDLKIITVVGDSMMPEFQPNQRVLVDITDQVPTPAGIFVVWDGLSLCMKRVQFVAFSEPARVKLSSINPAYDPYERLLGEAYIQGRVIGRWAPT